MPLLRLPLLVLVLIVSPTEQAYGQMQLPPGQSVQICNTLGHSTGMGISCQFHAQHNSVLLVFNGQSWWMTFWGDGTAQSLLPRLCLDHNLKFIIETVIERNKNITRTRRIPCATGKSQAWIVENFTR